MRNKSKAMASVINIANEETASSRHAPVVRSDATFDDHNLENIKKLPADDKLGIINNLAVTYDWNSQQPLKVNNSNRSDVRQSYMSKR